MSMGPVMGGILGSAAGAPLSQTAGSESERAQKDAATQQRQVETDQHAEDAAGVGQTEEDQETSDRDADGRRLWEMPPGTEQDDDAPRKAKDTTGQCGNNLDLTG